MSRYRRIDDDDWIESTEGDLDPDLVEEQPYSAWEPSARDWIGPTWRIVAALVVISLVASLLLPLI